MIAPPPSSLRLGQSTPNYQGWQNFGDALSIGGVLTSAVGAYYQARSAQDQAKSQALSAEFEAFMANLDARQAEVDANTIMDSAKQEIAFRGLQSAQEQGAASVDAAARGVGAGGSAAEVKLSIEIARRVDALTITKNTMRDAAAARRQGVNARNQASMARVSADNLRRSARTISPGLAAGGALLQGASVLGRSLGGDYRYRRS